MMRFVTVDNNGERLTALTRLLKSTFPGCTVAQFTDPLMSAKYIINNEVDAVFAETAMRPADGPQLKHVIEINRPNLPVLLIGEEKEKTLLWAEADLMRPLSEEVLKAKLFH